MKSTKIKELRQGAKDGIPISLGYLAVGLTLGIAARKAGFNVIQAGIVSLTNNASAGEYAAFALITAGASYVEVAIMTLVANIRYMLMSFAISQKLTAETATYHRMLMGFDLTDEIFGISVARKKLSPYYTYGAILVALPGWSGGTMLGVLLGDFLPKNIVSALGVGLFGMFIAIIIPPAKKSKILLGIITFSMAASFAFSRLSIFDNISSGTKTIILTVAISLVAAILFPVKEGEASET